MIKLTFYVPETHLDVVKQAVFEAGGGRMGDYDSCAWQTLGQGQFRPGEGSDPFIGEQGVIETVAEYQVEVVCEDKLLPQVIAALRQAHPYEEPAYGAWSLLDV